MEELGRWSPTGSGVLEDTAVTETLLLHPADRRWCCGMMIPPARPRSNARPPRQEETPVPSLGVQVRAAARTKTKNRGPRRLTNRPLGNPRSLHHSVGPVVAGRVIVQMPFISCVRLELIGGGEEAWNNTIGSKMEVWS
ncbi:hypothetical protein GWK47_037800 [Chionoecetes opilio]|uniref:Uncharacterized protein n=1 Tax=Chionoecetes opilio TaxID=41210 RepID=A0A8J5CYK2_CHIOP|nr:hypothetical protein GWK47_037800 [Chionoecetes opilio]